VHQLQAYKNTQLTTSDPGTVLLALYQGAIDALRNAAEHASAGNMAEKGRYVLRANDIINQFLVSLDFSVGGELAQNLADLYNHMLDQILSGNLNNDGEKFHNVAALLCTLKEGWESAVADQRRRAARGAA
jgi:flagellar protein FliS